MLHLPFWATDCLKRREPALARLGRPFALYESQHGGMRLVALDRAGLTAGLHIGQSLADARAMAPGLYVRAVDHRLLAAIFADFADWHSYASPMVTVLTDQAPYGDLVLDITGVAHLFGGEAAMLTTVTSRLEALGFAVAGAVADTVGAAWALARCRPGAVVEGDPGPALAALPVSALRLTPEQVLGLGQLGLRHIGQLAGRSRKGLMARFGEGLMLRLDQALGRVEERPEPRLPMVERQVARGFAEPIGRIEDVLEAVRELSERLCAQLQQDQEGAQDFHLFLYRVDHRLMHLPVRAARATRDPGHILRLFANRTERLAEDYDPGFGIDFIRLAAETVSPLAAAQGEAFAVPDGTPDLDRLYDRIASRLGPEALVRSKFVDTHVPERAVALEPVLMRRPDEPGAAPDPALARPLRLLPHPEPIRVVAQVPDGPPGSMTWRGIHYRLVRASGPERIAAEWWSQRIWLKRTRLRGTEAEPEPPADRPVYGEGGQTRDYYVAEDEAGRRYWLFRLGLYGYAGEPVWYLHGLFP